MFSLCFFRFFGLCLNLPFGLDVFMKNHSIYTKRELSLFCCCSYFGKTKNKTRTLFSQPKKNISASSRCATTTTKKKKKTRKRHTHSHQKQQTNPDGVPPTNFLFKDLDVCVCVVFFPVPPGSKNKQPKNGTRPLSPVCLHNRMLMDKKKEKQEETPVFFFLLLWLLFPSCFFFKFWCFMFWVGFVCVCVCVYTPKMMIGSNQWGERRFVLIYKIGLSFFWFFLFLSLLTFLLTSMPLFLDVSIYFRYII